MDAYGGFMLWNGKNHHSIKKKEKTQEKGNSTRADNELWSIFINFVMLHKHFNMLWKTRLLFSIYYLINISKHIMFIQFSSVT